MISRLQHSQPHSHHDVILIDVIRYWAGHAQRYGRTLRTYVRTDTLPRLIYKDTVQLLHDNIPQPA